MMRPDVGLFPNVERAVIAQLRAGEGVPMVVSEVTGSGMPAEWVRVEVTGGGELDAETRGIDVEVRVSVSDLGRLWEVAHVVDRLVMAMAGRGDPFVDYVACSFVFGKVDSAVPGTFVASAMYELGIRPSYR